MDTAATTTIPNIPDQPGKAVAGPLHTVIFLLILGAYVTWSYFVSGHMRMAQGPSRLSLYVTTMIGEWLLVAYILFGVRRHGTSLLEVLGPRWKNAQQIFRDIGIALGFWILSLVILAVVAHLLKIHGMDQNVGFLLPHGPLEIAVWLGLSATAGICEETIFRGYLQKQFVAGTGNVAIGVLLSAAAFGAAHAYQGWKSTILIAVYGLLFGILAQMRGSVRPGMISHCLQDSVSGIAARFLPR
jgi:hypothetical protein